MGRSVADRTGGSHRLRSLDEVPNEGEVREVPLELRRPGCTQLELHLARLYMRRPYQLNRPPWQRIREFSTGLPSFGLKIRSRRESLRRSIRSLAEDAEVTPHYWSEMEQGRRWPAEKDYKFLADFFDTTVGLLKQDLDRTAHDIRKWTEKYKDVVDWLKRETKADETHRTLIIRQN